jgi:thiamine pyrophosphokinase
MILSHPKRAVLLANGELLAPAYARSLIQDSDMIIVVNGGTGLAWELKIVPDLLIGDTDSLALPLQDWLAQHCVARHTYPADKDFTDLELALHHVISLGIAHLLFLGLAGKRTDHMLANFSLLALAREAQIQAEVVVGQEHIYLVYDELELTGKVGQTISLLPWGGNAVGVRTRGMKWELHGEKLPFGRVRGMSNIMRHNKVHISLSEGMLLVVHQRGEIT